MKHHRPTKVAGSSAPAAAKILAALLVVSCLDFEVARAVDAPLTIAKQGNFYIGGKYVENNGDMPMVGQAFVQYQIPQSQTHPYPIVMIHGGSQTGSGWISTPDGRDGWAIYFLHGYAVYVVDQGRARTIGLYRGRLRSFPNAAREYVMQ